jgi:hypothetical protein
MGEDRGRLQPGRVVRITVEGDHGEDRGAGLVISRSPFRVLVPSHVVELLEEDRTANVLVDDVACTGARILPTQALQRDHLSVVELSGIQVTRWRCCPFSKALHALQRGQTVALERPGSAPPAFGSIQSLRETENGSTLVVDIPIDCGESGCPLLVDGHVVAICQGMVRQEGGGSCVATPISPDGLAELRKLTCRRGLRAAAIAAMTILLVGLALWGFSLYSAASFTLGEFHVSEDELFLEARNTRWLTLHRSWSRSFPCGVFRTQGFSSRGDGVIDRIGVGTRCSEGKNGAFYLLDAAGRTLWSHQVPQGDCVYSFEKAAFDHFLVEIIHIADLDGDGIPEILLAFVHRNFYPSKLVVLDQEGTVLGEYWHPGYLRTLAAGPVGPDEEILVIASASNNAIRTSWWNPQVLFAFRATEIYGLAPPYDHHGAADHPDHPRGTELWYKVLLPVDDRVDEHRMRGAIYDINIGDLLHGNGVNVIQTRAQESRFYYLNERGETLQTSRGNTYFEMFPGIPVPPLVDIWEYMETYLQMPDAEDSSGGS